MQEWCPFSYLLIISSFFIISCHGKGSLTFVIDDTLSMRDDIGQVKRSADAITRIVFEDKGSQIQNMVLVTFNDPHAKLEIVTNRRDVFKQHINQIYVHSRYNWDCAEPSMNGILLGLEASLPGSFIYVFTDASSKDHSFKSRDVKNLCQKKQSQVTFVLTGTCSGLQANDFQVYYEIATACAGLAFYVDKREVNEVLDTIRNTISGNKTVLTSVKVPPGRYTDIPFIIDDQTEYAIVSASGLTVSLTITGPKAVQERLMWIDNGKVIKLNDPTPGKYIAIVMGHTETSVYIVGRTDFLFAHGFSTSEPKSLSDTTPQPVADAETRLSIAVTDPKYTVNIISAQILDMNENVLKVLPLNSIGKDFYTTTPFVAPSQRFKIAVKGKSVRDGKDIKRIAKIPVTPQEPPKPELKKPVVTIPEGQVGEVEYGQTMKLTCRVSAYPQPTIKWKDGHGITLTSQSSILELPYEYISYVTIKDASKGDTYSCHAENKEGSANKSFRLVVKEPFDVKSVVQGTIDLRYGVVGILKCDITASVPMHIYWTYEDQKTGTTKQIVTSNKYEISSDGKQLKLNTMDLDMVGKYSCKASLDKDPSKFVVYKTQVEINGLEAPKITGVNEMTVRAGATVRIECKVIKGVPAPTITWQFKGKGNTKFGAIARQDRVLHLSTADKIHAGHYKCVAQNVVGTAEHVTVLKVQYAPQVVAKLNTTYKGLEGDVALRIPCDVVGDPKPTITWRIGETVIVPNDHYSINNGTLIIKNPKASDSNSYVCEARNFLGVEKLTFHAEVNTLLDDYGTVKEVNILEGTTKKLECGSNDPNQSVRWFVEGVDLKIDKKHIYLSNVDVSNEGNYTCRVSDINGAYTLTYEVIVGTMPQFLFKQNDPVIDWQGTEVDIDLLDCAVKAKPATDVTWTYNGKVLENQHSSYLAVSGNWGHYTCNASNVFGAVQRTFDVISSNCFIKRENISDRNLPLILDQGLSWPSLDSTDNYLQLSPEQTIVFFCPANRGAKNNLAKFYSNEITARCVKQDMFIVNNKMYKVSDLRCVHEIDHMVKEKHGRCLTKSSDLIRVGYDVHGFLETYAVCYDTSMNIPLYSRMLMSQSNRGRVITHNWSKFPGVRVGKSDKRYTCANATSLCCYRKTQLVNARDVSDGAAQRSTYLDPLNVIPYWRPCNKIEDPWENLESVIRSQLLIYPQFIVWSGIHTLQQKNGQIIPRYLWKVLRFDEDEALAVVYVNDPMPSVEDNVCTNICVDGNIPWLPETDERTYCCNLDEFLLAFGLQDTSIGESIDGALSKIKSKKY